MSTLDADALRRTPVSAADEARLASALLELGGRLHDRSQARLSTEDAANDDDAPLSRSVGNDHDQRGDTV
jgi:hypothetical protein